MKNVIMHLKKGPFEKIKKGEKVVEMRLYDDKRKELKVGDTITYILVDDESQKVVCSIENILVYDNFEELYADYDKSELGYDENEDAKPSDMEEFYPKEEQQKYGVVAIEMELIDNQLDQE